MQRNQNLFLLYFCPALVALSGPAAREEVPQEPEPGNEQLLGLQEAHRSVHLPRQALQSEFFLMCFSVAGKTL